MTLNEILMEAKSSLEYDLYELIDEYDEDDCLITILYEDGKVFVHIQDILNDRHNVHMTDRKDFEEMTGADFERLINELWYYAQ